MSIKHTHPLLPPGLVVLKNQKYLTPGWKKVPMETTLKDIIWDKPKVPTTKEEVFEFFSKSDPNIKYITKRFTTSNQEITYSCTCPGVWRSKDRKCKHIKSLL